MLHNGRCGSTVVGNLLSQNRQYAPAIYTFIWDFVIIDSQQEYCHNDHCVASLY